MNVFVIDSLSIAFFIISTIALIWILSSYDKIAMKSTLQRPYSTNVNLFIDEIKTNITIICKEFHPSTISVYFILNEVNDTTEPYFSLIRHIIESGCSIKYLSDRSEVIELIPGVIEKIVEKKIVDMRVAKSLIGNELLTSFPNGDNLCFIVQNETTLLAAYSAYRAGRVTVGGTSLSKEEAQIEWKGLNNVRKCA